MHVIIIIIITISIIIITYLLTIMNIITATAIINVSVHQRHIIMAHSNRTSFITCI